MSTPVSLAEKIDQVVDCIPVLSAVTNLVHLFFKYAVFSWMSAPAAVGSYRAYLEKKPGWKCVLWALGGGFVNVLIRIFQKSADPKPSDVSLSAPRRASTSDLSLASKTKIKISDRTSNFAGESVDPIDRELDKLEKVDGFNLESDFLSTLDKYSEEEGARFSERILQRVLPLPCSKQVWHYWFDALISVVKSQMVVRILDVRGFATRLWRHFSRERLALTTMQKL